MRFQAELCHVDTLRCVVRVEAWTSNDDCLGSRLGEAANAEEAEDRARQRLLDALADQAPEPEAAIPAAPVQKASVSQDQTQTAQASAPKAAPAAPTRQAPLPVPSAQPADSSSAAGSASTASAESPQQRLDLPSETPTDPEDWSEELTAIDMELKRIGWERKQERIFLERAFGHAGRHRLTRYADLVAYLRQLRQFQPGDQPEQAMVPIRRSDLISQGDQMLRELGWSGEQARSFLQQHLKAKSRQQLSDEQLLQFNLLLEEQKLKASKGNH